MSGITPTATATTVSPTLFFDTDATGPVDFQTLKAASDTIKVSIDIDFCEYIK